MKILIILALAGIATSKETDKIRFDEQFHPLEFVHDEGWLVWKSAHNKAYTDFGEEKVRYTIWKDNFHRIEEHNRQNSKSYVLGMNHFGDLTNTEFKALMNGYMSSRNLERTGSTFVPPFNADPPTAINWILIGAVTPVKNQGQCGSCWSFSTTGALEGQHWRKTGKLVSLSEQNLIDCSTKFGNHGCHGGIMDNAFKYIKENHGIDTEESYPYEAKELTCRFNRKNVGASDTGIIDILSGNETALQFAVGFVGPVSVAIDASHFSFQFYKKGVYNDPQCSPQNLDHGVLVAGYGETYEGQQYWLVKNSWSERWGEKGYIRMSRNKGNQCGIASMGSFPLVD